MDPRTESIKQEVEETLEDMAAKMEQIEERVVGTARETVEHVKEKFDVRHMVAERPWTMLGVSMAAGFVVGSIRRSGGRVEESDGRALPAGSWQSGARSRAFQYEHSDDPYERVEDEEFGPSLFQGGGEPLREGMGQMGGSSEGFGMTQASQQHGLRGGEEYGQQRMGGQRGQVMGHESERPHRTRQLVQRSISQVKQRAPGILAVLRENFGDEIEALKRAVVVAAGNSLRGIMQSKLPQLAEEFDRARQETGNHRGENGLRGEQRQQTWQGQGTGQGNQGYQAPEGRYGTEGRGGSQGQPMSSSAESEGGSRNRGNESYGPEGGQGPTGRKSHN